MEYDAQKPSRNAWPENVVLPLLVLYLLFQIGVISFAAFQPDQVAPWVCVAAKSYPGQANGPGQENDAGDPDAGEECLIRVDVNLGLGFTIAAFWLASIVHVEPGRGSQSAILAVNFSKLAAPAVAVYLAIWLGLQSATLWFGLMIAIGFVMVVLIYLLTAAMGLILGAVNVVKWLVAKLRQPIGSGGATVENAARATTPLEAMRELAGPSMAAYPERVSASAIWSAIEELYEILTGLSDGAAVNGVGYLWSACGMLNVVYAHRDEPLAVRLVAIWQANYCVTAVVPLVSNDHSSKTTREVCQLVQGIQKDLNSLSAALYRLDRPNSFGANTGI